MAIVTSLQRHLRQIHLGWKESIFLLKSHSWYRIRHFSDSQSGRLVSPWKILFFGTDDFALSHLKALNCARIDNSFIKQIEVVVPNRKCPVRMYAQEEKLKYHIWPLSTLPREFNLGVIVSFGHLIPGKIIQSFEHGMINVHPSLLPKWRGASPILHTVLHGETETGITIIKIRPKRFDIGPIVMQKKFLVPENSTGKSLTTVLAKEGSEMLINCLKNVRHADEVEQKGGKFPIAHKFTVNNSCIDWNGQTPDQIDRQYRALADQFPLRSSYADFSVKLSEMVLNSFIEDDAVVQRLNLYGNNVTPGFPVFVKKQNILCVKCKSGWVAFRRITLKKNMTAQEFYNGYLSKDKHSNLCFSSSDNGLKFTLDECCPDDKKVL